MSQITYPSGRLVSYTRDTTGRITQVRTKKTASVTTWTTLVSSVTRRPMTDLVASLSYGNGLTESNTYTLDHELSRCRVLDGATALVDLQPLRADGLNITGLTDTVTPTNSQTFGYSVANRLTSATGAYGAYSWTYDLVGNRTSEGRTPPGGSLTTDSYSYTPRPRTGCRPVDRRSNLTPFG